MHASDLLQNGKERNADGSYKISRPLKGTSGFTRRLVVVVVVLLLLLLLPPRLPRLPEYGAPGGRLLGDEGFLWRVLELFFALSQGQGKRGISPLRPAPRE